MSARIGERPPIQIPRNPERVEAGDFVQDIAELSKRRKADTVHSVRRLAGIVIGAIGGGIAGLKIGAQTAWGFCNPLGKIVVCNDFDLLLSELIKIEVGPCAGVGGLTGLAVGLVAGAWVVDRNREAIFELGNKFVSAAKNGGTWLFRKIHLIH